MGCVSSKSDDQYRPNVFHVWNVDDMGNRVNPGEIVITETDLILYQRGKQPVRWPMRSLRRYGFDSELFSFESGRRCPTGPGVYAFRCRRAEALFTLLQEHIQSVGNNVASVNNEDNPPFAQAANVSLVTVNMDGAQRLQDDVPAISNHQEPRYCGCPCPPAANENPGENSQADESRTRESVHYVNSDVIPAETSSSNATSRPGNAADPEYINTIVRVERNSSSASKASAMAVGAEHEYMNTALLAEGASAVGHEAAASSRFADVNANTKSDDVSADCQTPHAYCNLPKVASRPAKSKTSMPIAALSTGVNNSVKPRNGNQALHINGLPLRDPFYSNVMPSAVSNNPPVNGGNAVAAPEKTVHYAILDLNGIESPAYSETPDEDSNGKGYVTIDFDKTAALLNSTTERQKQTGEVLLKVRATNDKQST